MSNPNLRCPWVKVAKLGRHAIFAFGIACLLVSAGSGDPGQTADALTPEAVMKHAQERFDTLTDYDCLIDTDLQAGSRREAGPTASGSASPQ